MPKGILVHSTATPGVMAADWYSRWNKSYKVGQISRQACVHAFIDDNEVYQYLPWDHRGWHAGGNANNTHIGFEICEPAGISYSGGSNMMGYDVAKQEVYFRKAWNNAVELCVMLCRKYGLNETNIICHSEGYKQGIASNHGDVMHWFPKHGESMGTFRAAVKVALNTATVQIGNASDSTKKYYRVQVGAFSSKGNADKQLIKLKNAGYSDAFIKTVTKNGAPLYRVQVGAFSIKDNAHRLLAKVKSSGFSNAFIQVQ